MMIRSPRRPARPPPRSASRPPHVLRRVLHVLVPQVPVLYVSPKGLRCVGSDAGRWRRTTNTSSAPSSAAPGFSRLKMTSSTTNTFKNNFKSRGWWWRRRRRRRWWWWWLCLVGNLLLEHIPTTPSTKGKRLGQRTCIGRVAQGQRGGGMRVLGVFEN